MSTCPVCLAKSSGEGRWLCGRVERDGRVVKRCESSTNLALRFLDAHGIQGRKIGYHVEEEECVRRLVVVPRASPAPFAPKQVKAEFAPAVMSAYGKREEK